MVPDLAAFVLVVDRLISLAKAKEEANQHTIKDVIDPFFTELQAAYTDFQTTLRKAKSMLEKSQQLSTIVKRIKRLRAKDLILRDKLREMAEAYENVFSEPEIKEFFQTARYLFGYWNGYHSSATLRIIDTLDNPDPFYGPDFVIESIGWEISAGEKRWRILSGKYAAIKGKYMQPIALGTAVGNSKSLAAPPPRWQSTWLEPVRKFLKGGSD